MATSGYFDDAVERAAEDPDEAEDFDFDPPEVPLPSGRGASETMERYFAALEGRMRVEYELARRCREKGIDPETRVEIPPAIDLAARVEELVGPKGVAERIRELAVAGKNREELSLIVAKEVAAGRFGAIGDKRQSLDQAVRTGLAILTEGILVAPLEGIAGVRILKNDDGTDCASLSFAGPIRAAGGTGQALSVLIADVVRRELGIGKYVPTEREIARMKEEIPAYKQAANLQYMPSNEEIELIMKSCPVMIDGEGTEKEEVGGNRDLPRIETNQLRGGACLVLAEGMTQKAPKIQKNVKALNLDGWGFIDQVIEYVKKKGASAGGDKGGGKKFTDPWAKEQDTPAGAIEPNPKFMLDLIAGRPVFANPSRKGGWRLRYGRSRTGGLATTSIHPAAMSLTDDFLAPGTQMKVERPGKATACTPCDTIDPPIALLHNGSLVEVTTYAMGKQLRPMVKRITDLGEILVPYGEFAENNKTLPTSPWCEEWWEQLAQKVAGEAPTLKTSREAFAFAERTDTPLHPRWNLFWHDVTIPEVVALSAFIEKNGAWENDGDGHLVLAKGDAEQPMPDARSAKDVLVDLGALHDVAEGRVRVGRHSYALLRCLGLDARDGRIVRRRALDDEKLAGIEGTCPFVSALAGVRIKPRGMYRVGTRMGRPEKAAERKMNPPVHLLFPIGTAGGPQRLLADASKTNKIEIEVGERECPSCRERGVTYRCANCGAHTTGVEQDRRIEPRLVEIAPLVSAAMANVKMDKLPEVVKAVQGLVSAKKTPEPIEKGILRAKHGIFTFKDGTVRFDMINITLTHFKPREAHVSVEKLRELGYTHDAKGEPLTRDDQVCELKVQDIIVSTLCLDYMLKTSQYVDELLVKLYGYKAYYNCQTRDDMLGHLFVALAPHTSGGVLCRIIGHNKAQGHYGHPYFHAAKRRNCLAPDSEIFIQTERGVERVRLDSLWDRAQGPETTVDDVGTTARTIEARVHAADPATGVLEARRVTRVYRAPSPGHLLRIKTASGREVTCTPQHRLQTFEGDAIEKRKAAELAEGDELLFASSVPHRPSDPPAIDLVEEGLTAGVPIVVRNIRPFLDELIEQAGGLKRAAAEAGVSMGSLDNHRRRDSMPAVALRALMASVGRTQLPATARVGVPRDDVSIPARLDITPEFARLLGYYLAEGHARSQPGRLYQVSFAATEQEVIDDLTHCIARAFGITPNLSAASVTISSRVVHALFSRVLGVGSNAREKRVPAFLLSAPHEITRELLSAYFSGDGGVEAGRLHVTATSVEPGLLRDIGLLLSARGIAYRLSRSERPAGGAVREFLERKGRPQRTFISHRLSIRSSHAVRFARDVGFTLSRKQKGLEASLSKERSSRMRPALGDLVRDEVVQIDVLPSIGAWVYDLEVEEHHNFLVNDGLLSSNCDGDEDCVMLLLDGLLNFSRAYLPSNRGGLMDAPLTLTMRIDPSEVDKEAHNVDVPWRYPLEFYEATQKHPGPKDVEKLLDRVAVRLGKPEQYEGFGFTHDTADVAEGPAMSAYKTIGSMMDKMDAQLDLATRIRAVDAPDVAARILGSHFLPDLMGNLKAFSKQAVRCTKCNAKYRRPPVAGKCRKCGNANLTMTVHEGSVKKYLEVSLAICDKYGVDKYTRQRIEHIADSIDSTFQNDRVKKAKLSDFF